MMKFKELKNAEVLTREQLRKIVGGTVEGDCPDGERLFKCVTIFNGGGQNMGVGCCSYGQQCESRALAALEQQGVPRPMVKVACVVLPPN